MNNKFKSGTYRKVFTKLSSRVAIHFKKRKPSKAHCSVCGRPLGGMAQERPVKMKNLPKSQKRPERIFGGVMCPSCLKRYLIENSEYYESNNKDEK
ncbi:MAG: 50S ribosomal protein L34e [Candidatus Nanoarchaeia archaeon]|nr:50S ribosomal protein L34e [Candidatus Nanoarchaeia archaeon]